jgi:hypothetical protein
LAVTQPSELFAVAEQKLDLETRPIQLHQVVYDLFREFLGPTF